MVLYGSMMEYSMPFSEGIYAKPSHDLHLVDQPSWGMQSFSFGLPADMFSMALINANTSKWNHNICQFKQQQFKQTSWASSASEGRGMALQVSICSGTGLHVAMELGGRKYEFSKR